MSKDFIEARDIKGINNEVQEQCFDIIRLNPSSNFTAERLSDLTGFSVRKVKYNVNLLIKRGLPIEEEHVVLKYPKGSSVYSNGYYYHEQFVGCHICGQTDDEAMKVCSICRPESL
jgi:translation initiation factor 2 beta subunit (eIF-2beta)/eIF-5